MDIKSKLNDKQYQAAASKAQYLRIIAGAGTGKTRTLTYRISYLITEGYKPNRMVAITFTNKVAKEMQERVKGLLDEAGYLVSGHPLISTFHGFCYRFLRKEITELKGYTSNFQIADSDDQNAIYKQIFSHMLKGQSKDFTKAVISKVSSLKTDGLFPNDVKPATVPLEAIYNYEELMKVYRDYQSYLYKQNLLDFDDLLMLTMKIMKQNPTIRENWRKKYDIFLIDEFQDTNIVQYELVKLFLGKDTMLTVVGDPDQTIYTWRGAQNSIIKDSLPKDFKNLETVVLDDNYRSTQSILDAANSLINHNSDRLPKDLKANSGDKGLPVEYYKATDGDFEALRIATSINKLVRNKEAEYDDFAIIYRSNYLSNPIEKKLTQYKIPYEIYGGLKFYERSEIKDALSYLRILVNPDDISFQRVLKAPSKGIGLVTLNKAFSIQDLSEDSNLLDIFRNNQDEINLTAKSKAFLASFYESYDLMRNKYNSSCQGDELITAIREYFNAVGFFSYVKKEDEKLAEKQSFTASTSVSKVDNVNEFIRSLSSFLEGEVTDDDGETHEATLEDYLLEVALQSDQDTMKDSKKVSLMTGHVSKGLEFPYVFVTGLNENVFPNSHAVMSGKKANIEEERRLLYVCLTRAKKRLFISSFGGKSFFGTYYVPSRFLKELSLASVSNGSQADYSYNELVGSNRPSSPNSSLFNDAKRRIHTLVSGSVTQRPTGTEESYVVGDRVIHTSFGKGEVIEVTADHKITVKFKEPFGVKRLMIGFKAFRKMKEGE